MTILEQAYKKLNGHYPVNIRVFYFKGNAITKEAFYALDGIL